MELLDYMAYSYEELTAGGCINTQNDDLPRVYFLIKGQTIIYIGQTINLGARVSDHQRSKDFDSISFLSVPKEIINDVEAQYIVRFTPEDNSGLHSNSLYCGRGKLKSLVKDQYEESMLAAIDSMEVIYVSRSKHVKYVSTNECVELSRNINTAIKLSIASCVDGLGK